MHISDALLHEKSIKNRHYYTIQLLYYFFKFYLFLQEVLELLSMVWHTLYILIYLYRVSQKGTLEYLEEVKFSKKPFNIKVVGFQERIGESYFRFRAQLRSNRVKLIFSNENPNFLFQISVWNNFFSNYIVLILDLSQLQAQWNPSLISWRVTHIFHGIFIFRKDITFQ